MLALGGSRHARRLLGAVALLTSLTLLVCCSPSFGGTPLPRFSNVKIFSGSRYKFKMPTFVSVAGGNLWFVNFEGGSVTGIKGSNGALISVLNDSKYHLDSMTELVTAGANFWALTGDHGGRQIDEISGASGTLVRTLVLPAALPAGAFSWIAGQDLWVNRGSIGSASIAEFSLETGGLLRTITTHLLAPTAMVVVGGNLWVADQTHVRAYSTTSGAYIRSVTLKPGPGFDSPFEMAVAKEMLWIPCGSHVYAINTTSGAILTNLSSKAFGFKMSMDAATNGSIVWITNDGANTVTAISASTRHLTAVMRGRPYDFSAPQGVAVLANQVWVGNSTQTAQHQAGGFVTAFRVLK